MCSIKSSSNQASNPLRGQRLDPAAVEPSRYLLLKQTRKQNSSSSYSMVTSRLHESSVCIHGVRRPIQLCCTTASWLSCCALCLSGLLYLIRGVKEAVEAAADCRTLSRAGAHQGGFRGGAPSLPTSPICSAVKLQTSASCEELGRRLDLQMTRSLNAKCYYVV